MRPPCCWRCRRWPGAGWRMDRLRELGEQLGSDVPFFLLGGAAVGIGRGTELFPLPDGNRAAAFWCHPAFTFRRPARTACLIRV